jgi:hypothetical protein
VDDRVGEMDTSTGARPVRGANAKAFAGVTNTDDFQLCRGSTRLNAANSERSAGVGAGRAT